MQTKVYNSAVTPAVDSVFIDHGMETARLTESQTDMYNFAVRPVVDSVLLTSWRQQDSYSYATEQLAQCSDHIRRQQDSYGYATEQLKISKRPHRFTKDLSLTAYWPNATEQLKLNKKPHRFTKDLSLTVYILPTCYSAAKAQ